MKTKIALIFAMGLLSQNALAFDAGANCSFDQAVGQCMVYNAWMAPIRCNVRIRGMVRSGAWFTGNEMVTVMPGQNAYAYVYANNPMYDPLVATNGSANCSF